MFDAARELIQTNPLLTAGIFATFSGMFWGYLKAIPTKVSDKLWKTFSSTAEFKDSHYDFYEVRSWVSTLKPVFVPKSYHVPKEYSLVQGPGTYWYRQFGRIFSISIIEDKDDKGKFTNLRLIIRVIGKNVDTTAFIVEQIGDWVKSKRSRDNFLKISIQRGNGFNTYFEEKRSPKTLFHDVYPDILSDIKWFIANKQWYADRGIPYHRGYLLYGPPGTGKTSIIKVMSGELGIPLYSIKSIAGLSDSLGNIETKLKIVVIEDIDRDFKEQPALSKMSSEEAAEIGFSGFKVSEFLNTVDGIISNDGTIFIFTANDHHCLPEAMLRPGRVDKKFEVGFLTETNIKNYIKLFVEPHNIEILESKLVPLANKVTGAVVQMEIMKFLEGSN